MVSEKTKAMLEALGMTQSEIKGEKQAKPAKPRHEKTQAEIDLETRKRANRAALARLSSSEPTEAILKRIEEREAREAKEPPREYSLLEWRPIEYVLYLRKNTCQHCGLLEQSLDRTEVFLRMRRRKADPSNARLMMPVKFIALASIPCKIEVVHSTSLFCTFCAKDFECQPNLQAYDVQLWDPALIVSLPEAVQKELAKYSPSQSGEKPMSSSPQAASSGITDSRLSIQTAVIQSSPDGFVSASGVSDSSADAPAFPIPTSQMQSA